MILAGLVRSWDDVVVAFAIAVPATLIIVGYFFLTSWWTARTTTRHLGAALQDAMRDGDLDDEEIQRLFPGAEVRHGEAGRFQILHSSVEVDGRVTRTFKINNVTYDRVEDIPDPELQARVRELLDGGDGRSPATGGD